MASVINEISAWAAALPFWEQAALDKVIAGTPINNEDYDDMTCISSIASRNAPNLYRFHWQHIGSSDATTSPAMSSSTTARPPSVSIARQTR